ncbi:LCP family protein required for cell wall assembly [Paenibacillus shirakamiensis]|uniref:LCP family protein required for cell wall assembly n=1 Tax=Paenibacillus shirakamiensis TaxID=1265935 RepID=A0ABS4JKU1_9BACL|nr:LCP family protein [Paenibacillus shirakamiensis]MBP2002332.1 LCP family protein required for cell wall assembly [Paenibacillus shirakamiensis]
MEERNAKPIKLHKRNKWKTFGIIMLVLIIVGGGVFVYRKPLAVMAFDMFLSGHVEKKLEKSYAPLKGEAPKPVVYQTKPFSTLLLGVDQRENEPARSDTMIYAVVRPKDSKILLISIPRDTYTEIVGKGKKDKINHAYAFGGEKMAKDTVDAFLGSKAEYYTAINFKGLRDVVDALGGIELPITKDIVNKEKDHEKFTILANKPIYDGKDALNYVRYREDSDFNRTKRHQIFLNAMVTRILQLNQVSKIPELMDIAGANFKTDMLPSSIIDLAKQMLTGEKSPQIYSFTIMGEGKRMNNVYYDIADEKDVKYAEQLIESWSNPNTTDSNLLLPQKQEIE